MKKITKLKQIATQTEGMPDNNQNTEDTLKSEFKFSCFLQSTKHNSNTVQM